MVKVIDLKCVFILGGGDGFVLWEVLKYEIVLYVDFVDLDEVMINMVCNVLEIVFLNKNVFFDNCVNVYVCDVKEFLNLFLFLYDVIIIDFLDLVIELLSILYISELFVCIVIFLIEDGVFVC